MEQRLRAVALESGEAELRQCGLLLRPPGQLFFRKLALRDVGVDAVDARRTALLVAQHGRAAKDPADSPVRLDDAVFDVAGSALEQAAAALHHAAQIVRMNDAGVIVEVLSAAALAKEEALVLGAALDGARDEVLLPAPDAAEGLRLDEQLFALAQRILRVHALGDVLVDHDGAHDGASFVADGRGRVANDLLPAAGSLDVDQLVEVGLPLLQSALRGPFFNLDAPRSTVPIPQDPRVARGA